MKINCRFKNIFLAIHFLLIACSGFCVNTPTAIKSPDGRTVFNLNNKKDVFNYSVKFENSILINNAPFKFLNL